METMQRDEATTAVTCRSNTETDELVRALVADGADPGDLAVVAHRPTPVY